MKPRHMLAIILVWAALLGGYLGSTLGFNGNELFYEEALDCVLTNTLVESNGFLMRLFYILFWIPNGPHSDLYLRLPNLILSLASLVAVYFLGTEIATSRRQLAGILSAFYLGINVLFISVLAHMRFYSANLFFVILATYCLVKARRLESKRWLGGYALCLAGAIGTMMLSSLVAFPHVIYYVWSTTDRRRACRQVAALGLALCVWFGLLCYRDQEATSRFNYPAFNMPDMLRPLLTNGYTGSQQIPQTWHPFFQEYTPTIVALMVATAMLMLVALGIHAKNAYCREGRTINLAPWLGVFTVIWAVVFYQAFSAVFKPIFIPLNVTWVLPFMALTLAQATLLRGWRWLYLVLLLNAVPQTHLAFLAEGTTNLPIMHTFDVWRHPGEPLLVSNADMSALHYLRKEYPLSCEGGTLTHPRTLCADLARSNGLLVYHPREFPAVINAICQQHRPVCRTVWVLIFQCHPELPEGVQPEESRASADYYSLAIQQAVGGIYCDCLVTDSIQRSVLYRLSLPAVRQYRPTPLRYRVVRQCASPQTAVTTRSGSQKRLPRDFLTRFGS